jgi:hypothetical protein
MGGSGSSRQAAPKLPKGKYRLWGDVVSRDTSEPPKKQARSKGDASVTLQTRPLKKLLPLKVRLLVKIQQTVLAGKTQ